MFIGSSDESCTLDIYLNKRIYRLLDEYKLGKCSNSVVLKEDIPNYRECKKKDISNNNKKDGILKRKQPNKSLNNWRFYTQVPAYNKQMSDRNYFYFKKQWVNKNDSKFFQEKNSKIRDIDIKKIKFRSYGFGVAVLLLFFLFGIGYPILQGLDLLKPLQTKLLGLLTLFSLDPTPIQYFICSIFFGVLIIILAIVIITTIPKILINNEKYKKFKLMYLQKE
ncbi:Plasmodium exported protein (Pm-fam-a like), unknown function [Plasmodium malariae]|uniref:Uncharacterized protein n=1 Tax=Plasmodium malariae TaxID=5858 RepID=A0A1A8X381_PLAMA|nr:Plasmodium exported protein (Pm-fam-a like), unknown function [Plasmodium malariae]